MSANKFYKYSEDTPIPAIIGASSAVVVAIIVIFLIAAVCVKKKKTEKTLHAMAVSLYLVGKKPNKTKNTLWL
jgi:hypothetical protein